LLPFNTIFVGLGISKKMSKIKTYLFIINLLLMGDTLFSQTKKFNIQTSFPSAVTVCGKTDSLVFEIRNISSSSVNTVYLTLDLPLGCNYKSSSFKGNGVSESNISNLNDPIFKLSDFSLAGYLRFSIKINSNCDLQTLISKGASATADLLFSYTGGNEKHTTGALNVNIPNILINTISNQVKNAYLGNKFFREISIKNTGKGGASTCLFFRINGNGLKITTSRSKDKYSGDSTISKLDSIDFKLIGNKDIYFDAGEEVRITDTARVVKCFNLTSVYTVRFGCNSTYCNTSSKNAIVNLDPFTEGLTIIPKTSVNWCFDRNKPTYNEIIVINKSNKSINNTYVNILQSYNGGFYNSQISAIDTSSIVVTAGKYGTELNKKKLNFRNNSSSGYFSCLGSVPIGGFTLSLGSLMVGDTIYVKWQSYSCLPNICNATLTAHRWRYSATYSDTCGNNYSVAENWGSGGGIQYMSAIPWLPTDIVSGVPEKLNYTISSISLFPITSKAKFSIKLTLQSGLKHSLKPDDIKFTDIYGNQWKPYSVKASSGDVLAYFYQPGISLVKAELDILIESDCKASSPSGLKNFGFTIFYAPDTTCNYTSDFQLYCTSSQVKVHCTKSCSNGGMLFKAFSVKRKSLGKPDNNNDGQPDATGTIDLAKIKTNRSFLYDTLTTFYSGIVMVSGSTNVFFDGRIKTSILNGNLLKPIMATLTVYRNKKVRYTCNKIQFSSYTSGTTRYCEVDLNINSSRTAGCGSMSNYFFLASDSVVVSVDYLYNTNVGSASADAFFDNPEFYISTTPNPTASQKLQCDTFSGRHILLGSYFTNWYTENYTSSSCNPVTLYNSYYFSAGNCCDNYAGGNPFPYEYRSFNYLDKIKVTLPKGYTFSSAAIYYYRSAGTSNYTSHYASNLKPIIKNTDTLIFNLDTLFNATKGIFKRSDEGYQGTLVLNLTPKCNAAINTYESVKYSSYFKWSNVNATDLIENYEDNLKFDHPGVLISAINTLSSSKKDTFSWDIIVSNTKSGSSITNLWLSNSSPKNAKVLAVKDLLTGNNLSVKNGIFKAGVLSSTATRSFRILASSTNCKLDSFKIAVGWNCDSYPDSLEAYSCKNLLNYVNLILSPIPPLIISTLIEDTAQTDVCTNRNYKVIIANVDEDNIYGLKLKVTIPVGTKIVDTGMYYSFPYGSKLLKLPKPILVSGSTYEWALSDSLSALKNGLEKVSDTLKSRIRLQFLLETNCQITAGAFVSIMPDGKIGCGEPVKRLGFTGQPIKIKGVNNPYYSIITLTPDSINLCNPSVAFKSKIIYLGPTNTFDNDSLILIMPIGFEPDTASLKTIKINGRGVVKDVSGEKRWLWSIPKGLLPGDSSMIEFKLKITNKAPSCGSELFTIQSLTKKKAYCVKSNDSCDINVATGSFFKAFKLDRAEPIIKLISSVSSNSGDTGEIIDIAFKVTNNKKTIDTAINSTFYLIVDKNQNNKYDKSDLLIKKFTKTKGWITSQQINFSFKGFVNNSDICRLVIVSDSNNCQCLRNILPLLNIQLKNAGRDTSYCSNNSVFVGLDSIKKYKYEWLPTDYLSLPYQSKSIYKKANFSNLDLTQTYILKTTRPGGCKTYDTAVIKAKSYIYLPKLKDTSAICEGGIIQIGDTAKGGKGALSYSWTPNSGLSSYSKMVVNANPKISTKFFIKISDQNNCSIKDSIYLKVAKLPLVKIGNIGSCEKRNIQFLDRSNYFSQQKGNAIWRIDFNTITQTDPTFVFDTIGLYFVRLIASNQYGCKDSGYKYIRINGNPIVSNLKINQCSGDSVILTDKSKVALIGIKTVTWRFAADSIIGKVVSKIFTTKGNYKFTQIVKSDSGCISYLEDSLILYDKPKAGISIIGKCLNDTILFSDNSKFSVNDSISIYHWEIEDKKFFGKQAKLKFDTTGRYNVALRINTLKGCSDSFKKSFIMNTFPNVSFGISNYCPYDTIKLSNSTTLSKGSIKKYEWNIGNLYNSNLKSPVIDPLKEGNYTIKLKAISDSLCRDSLVKTFTVFPRAIAKAALIQGCENESMNFIDVSNQGNTNLGYRQWEISKSFYTDSIVTLALKSKGIFSFKLSIKTKEGCDFSLDSTYEVFENPVAAFTSNSKCMDDEVTFTDKSAPGGKSTLVSWQWFQNNSVINTSKSFSQRFAIPGTQFIALQVKNSFGCSDSINIPTITYPPNYVDFKFNDACPGDSVKLNFTGFTGSNTISNLNLSWGDGFISKTLPASHSYKASGNNTIKLTITTLAGCDYDTSKSVTLYPIPEAGFDFTPKYPDIKYPTISITDQSRGATKWKYIFGDGNSSALQNPKYSFNDSGKYQISQIVENQFGCRDTAFKNVYVNFLLLTFVPNAFSPGKDDINPLFQPLGLGIKDFKLTIFNRWGEKIYAPDWGRNAWDGTYKGEFVTIGMYPYYIEIIDFGNIKHNYHGVLNVIR
jgi:gliding motility-associated-like protein